MNRRRVVPRAVEEMTMGPGVEGGDPAGPGTTGLDAGMLILRLVVGLTIAAHGAQKLFGWFGGPGFTKMTQGLQTQGFKPGWLWNVFVILGELGGGLSLALGFLTPLGAAGIFGAMFMAIF